MNIALIGAPGSGKTALAYQLARRLEVYDPSCGCGERKVKIIDHYIGDIEAKAQIALGSSADYLGNLYVALERNARERVARMDHDIVITCGTLVETAVYVAMDFVAVSNIVDDAGRLELAPHMDAVLRIFAVLYNDICTYDHAFYLSPGTGDEETQFMDQQLQAGLEGFKLLPVTPLLEKETRVEDALKALEKREVPAA